jgi:TIGR03009 family protein
MNLVKSAWIGTALVVLSQASTLEAQPPGGPPTAPQRPGPGMQAGAAAQQQATAPLAPAWHPLSESHQKYVDQILQYWEFKSDQVERYRCTFKRWEYDPVFGPKDTFKTYGEGTIKYSAPDKGLFKVERLLHYQPPLNANAKPEYREREDIQGECWICDGTSVFEFDFKNKQLEQYELPPEMRGQAIGRGPLPFLFNAKADEIKSRFWIRVITPKEAQGEYWLEAYPKTRDDAANFKMVHVIIDEKEYLPKAMVLFDRNYIPGRHPSRTTFQFDQREVNFSILASKLNLFHREFFEPAVPSGWKKVVHRNDQSTAATGPNPRR